MNVAKSMLVQSMGERVRPLDDRLVPDVDPALIAGGLSVNAVGVAETSRP